MGLLHNTFKLTKNQRKAVAVLTVVLLLTNSHVQAAQADAILPVVQGSDATTTQAQVTPDPVLTVPQRFDGHLPTAARTVMVTVTAYASTVAECDDDPFTTADGSQVRDGIIAANFLKFGTKVRIPDLFGDKVFEVHDRMNARYQNRVDVWMDSSQKDREFGIHRNVKIEVL